jgi:hypothetical protein
VVLVKDIYLNFKYHVWVKRADVLLIYKNLIFILEFKVGAQDYAAQDMRQAHGYAIDLHHFHDGSHEKFSYQFWLQPQRHLRIIL